jgi:hypothetical protein
VGFGVVGIKFDEPGERRGRRLELLSRRADRPEMVQERALVRMRA